jgi:hypothetical protein
MGDMNKDQKQKQMGNQPSNPNQSDKQPGQQQQGQQPGQKQQNQQPPQHQGDKRQPSSVASHGPASRGRAIVYQTTSRVHGLRPNASRRRFFA